MTNAQQTDDYHAFYEWKKEHHATLMDWWGDYMDDWRTPGICSGFEDFCWQAFERRIRP